jgi:hypothetical protein
MSRKCRNLHISQPHGLPQPVSGTAFITLFFFFGGTFLLLSWYEDIYDVTALQLVWFLFILFYDDVSISDYELPDGTMIGE